MDMQTTSHAGFDLWTGERDVAPADREPEPRAQAWFGTGASAALGAVHRMCLDVVQTHAHGPMRAMCEAHLDGGGKQFRARLALAAVRALGGAVADAIPFAAACELMHNASLVHDDLQDGDRVRRGRPALWALHGADQAINAGDLLLMLPFLALDTPSYAPELRWSLSACLARRAARTACGQSLEQWARDTRQVSWDAYDSASEGKTGQFFALPVEGAALIAGHDRATASRLGDAVLALGRLFQLRDDVIDLYADKGRECRGNDVREGKLSALVVAHSACAPSDAAHVMDVLSRPRDQTTDAAVADLARRFRASGALGAVVQRARHLLASLTRDPALRAAPELHRVATGLAAQWLSHMEDAAAHATNDSRQEQ